MASRAWVFALAMMAFVIVMVTVVWKPEMDRRDWAWGHVIIALVIVMTAILLWPRVHPVASPATPTFGFVSASDLFLAERDVQWVGNTPHCIVRLVLAEAPEAGATYAEAPMAWCSGVD